MKKGTYNHSETVFTSRLQLSSLLCYSQLLLQTQPETHLCLWQFKVIEKNVIRRFCVNIGFMPPLLSLLLSFLLLSLSSPASSAVNKIKTKISRYFLLATAIVSNMSTFMYHTITAAYENEFSQIIFFSAYEMFSQIPPKALGSFHAIFCMRNCSSR